MLILVEIYKTILKKGEYNLHIKKVTVDDDAKYQCQVSSFEDEKAVKSDWAHLTVLGLLKLFIMWKYKSFYYNYK